MPSPRTLLTMALVIAAAAPAASGQERPVAYTGATIETVGEAGTIDRGTIVLRDGKIEALGPADKVEVPGDARVVDATGRTILPGIVEPLMPYNVPGEGPGGGGERIIIIGGRMIRLGGGGPTRPPTFTRIADVFYPYDTNLGPLLRSGLTHLNLAPREYGQAAVVRNTPEAPEAMVLEPAGRLVVSLSNATPSLDVVRKGLEATKPKEGGGPGNGGGRPGGGPPGGRPGGPPGRPGGGPPRSGGPSGSSDDANSSSSLWKAVAEGKAPLFVDASNAAAILYLLDILDDYDKVELALAAQGEDVYRVLDRLKGRRVTLLLKPTIDTLPNSRNRVNIPRLAYEAGLKVAFAQGPDQYGLIAGQDAPLFPIGYLVQTGLPRTVALQALTIRPAELLGLGDSLGSLEEGKSASILVFEGDPLDPYSRLRSVIIEGRTVYEED